MTSQIETIVLAVNKIYYHKIIWDDIEANKNIRKNNLSVLRKKILDRGKSPSFVLIGDYILDSKEKLLFYGYTEGTHVNKYFHLLKLTTLKIQADNLYNDIIIIKVPNISVLKYNQTKSFHHSLDDLFFLQTNGSNSRDQIEGVKEQDDLDTNNDLDEDEVGLDDEQQKNIYNQLMSQVNEEQTENEELDTIVIEDDTDEHVNNIKTINHQNEFTEEPYNYSEDFLIK